MRPASIFLIIQLSNSRACLAQMEKKPVMSFTYYPAVNEYMGRKTLQLTIVNYQ